MSVKCKYGLKALGVALLFGVSVSAYSVPTAGTVYHNITLKNTTATAQQITIGGLKKGSVAAGATLSLKVNFLPRLSPSGLACSDSLKSWLNDTNPRACTITTASCVCN